MFHISDESFLENLIKNNWVLFYLNRENTFLKVTSQIISKNNSYHVENNSKLESFKKVKIDISDLDFRIEKILNSNEKELDLLKNIIHKKIIYEKDLLNEKDRDRTMKDCLEYLNYPYYKLSTPLVKIQNNWKNFIINHDEIYRHIEKKWPNLISDLT